LVKLQDAECLLALRLRTRHVHVLAHVGFRHILALNLHDCAIIVDKYRLSALCGAGGIAGIAVVHLCDALGVADAAIFRFRIFIPICGEQQRAEPRIANISLELRFIDASCTPVEFVRTLAARIYELENALLLVHCLEMVNRARQPGIRPLGNARDGDKLSSRGSCRKIIRSSCPVRKPRSSESLYLSSGFGTNSTTLFMVQARYVKN
jgi:hypothetical protein